MKVEDNSYDFKVRDRLQKECRERNWKLVRNTEDNRAMIDMITYCSQGNEEEAVQNLKTSMEVRDGLNSTCRTLGLDLWWHAVEVIFSVEVVMEAFLFLFWKKSFIELKVSVHKNENNPRGSYHEVIMRDFGRFLNDQNFIDSNVFQAQVKIEMINFEDIAENSNNIFKELMREDEEIN